MGVRKLFNKNEHNKKDVLLRFDDDAVFSYRVGGILIKENKILLTKDLNGYTIPGGHVQFGETSEQTVVREFKEESNLDVFSKEVLAVYENFWEWNKKKCHQICIFHLLGLKNEKQTVKIGKEDEDKEFVWLELGKLKEITLHPAGIKEIILNEDAGGKTTIHKIIK